MGFIKPAESVGQIMFYRLIAEQCLDKSGYTRYWDESAKAPYLWHEDSAIFISYEDEESIRHKIEYLKKIGIIRRDVLGIQR